ncbi:MAG TPA: hypothetical protein VN676_06410 [Steroidobacteraceae bacterium]|nr:hypothetical protein [Steroidobacteraceae bacterium]
MGQVIGAIAVATFWLFITIVSVAAIMYDYRKKRLVVDTVRHAIEHGAQIDPALLDRLLSHQKHTDAREQALDPRLLKMGCKRTQRRSRPRATRAASSVQPAALPPCLIRPPSLRSSTSTAR